MLLQGRVDIPVMDGVTVPVSVRWANHRDLFTDKDEVIGHFGIDVDTSKLLDKASIGRFTAPVRSRARLLVSAQLSWRGDVRNKQMGGEYDS